MVLFPKIHLKKYFNKERNSNVQLRFLRRLSRVLDNGYPLLEALETIKWDKTLQSLTQEVMEQLKDGKSLDIALEQARFHSSITSFLYFIQVNGELQNSLRKCLEMFEKRLQYQQKFKQIIRYPLILIVIFSIIIFFISQSVLPTFAILFTDEQSKTINLATFLMDKLSVIFISFVLGIPIIWLLWRNIKDKIPTPIFINVIKNIPIYRKYISLQTSYLLANHLHSLLKTGMSMNQILTLLAEQRKQPIISYYSKTMAIELTKGVSIANLMKKLPLIERDLAEIFQKNSNIDTLVKDLSIYAEFLTDELNQKIQKAITYIQPTFFVIIGAFVVFIYFAMMWPLFQLIQSI